MVLVDWDAASREIAEVAPENARIIDTSTAFRTSENWVYGMPELVLGQRERIKAGNRISVPGCHATGFILLVRPLIENGIISQDYPLFCQSITGYSGGGKKMIAEYEDVDSESRDELYSPRQYALSQNHKHLPEMKKGAAVDRPPIFTPIVSDYYSGMMTTIPLHPELMKKKLTIPELHHIYSEHFEGAPLIHVIKPGAETKNGFLPAEAMSGRNDLDIMVYGNDERIILAARYDNLGKGASGAAVQCMNLMLNMPEETGLI